MTRRSAIRSVLAPAAVAAFAFGAIQLLETVFTSLSAPGPVTVMISIAGAVAGVGLARLRNRLTLERARKQHLRAWPLTRAQTVDPLKAGVFPWRTVARVDERGLPCYIERRGIDDELVALVRDSSFVLVLGERLVGKTRSTLQAVAALETSSQLLIPEGDAGLSYLLDEEDVTRLCDGPTVLWLDDWAQYLPSAANPALPTGGANGTDVKVVATMRNEDLDKLMRGDPVAREAARRLLSRARIVKLAPEPTSGELDAARAAFPEISPAELQAGLGRALAARPGEARPPTSAANTDSRPRQRDRIGAAAWGLAALLLGLAILFWITGVFAPPAALSDQADAIKHHGAQAAGRVVFQRHIDLHGSGESSYLFVFGNRGPSSDTGDAEGSRSDQLEIYDDHGGKLVRELRFAPRSSDSGSGVAVFRIRRAGDLNGDGASELIGGFGRRVAHDSRPVPFSVYWDDRSERYQLEALISHPPGRSLGAPGAALDRSYGDQVTLRDGREQLSGYPVADFVVYRGSAGLRFVAGYKMTGTPTRVRVAGWSLRFEGDEPQLHSPCAVPPRLARHLVLAQPPHVPLNRVLLEVWRRVDPRALC